MSVRKIMHLPNRKKGPAIITDYALEFPAFEHSVLSNNVSMYEVNSGTQDIIKVDLVFKVGRVNEVKRGSSKACFELIREGNRAKSSSEMAYHFDYYGAMVKVFSGLEYSYLSIVCITRHFDAVWEAFVDMVTDPTFPQEEMDKYKAVASQKLLSQLSKNDVQAYRKITEIIFGKNHPYGYNTEDEDIQALTTEDLRAYWNKNVGFNQAIVILSGKYSSSARQKVAQAIESLRGPVMPATMAFTTEPYVNRTETIETMNKAQTTLKIGRRLFGRSHVDYSKVLFMNTVLGGYFGSRLMKNIREEKGFTYGIYSSVDAWKKDGFIYISADVANKNVEATIGEIYREIDKLKTNRLEKYEFEMVKNYMLGQLLHLIDGPFETAQLIKSIYTKEIEIEHFKAHVSALKAMQPDDVLEMANKYLDEKTFTTVLAGKIK